MTSEQSEIAGAFMDELIGIGAVEEAPLDDPVSATIPLFCVPKAGQPGQWRIIANMKTGGQNDVIGSDPTYLPRVSTILPHLYSGGWSATVDASKIFHQFSVVVTERKYLGTIHSITGKLYRY